MKPTIANLATYLGKARSGLYEMKKVQPKQFQLLWNGWLEYCKNYK